MTIDRSFSGGISAVPRATFFVVKDSQNVSGQGLRNASVNERKPFS